MAIIDDITGAFNSVSDSAGAISTDIQTTAGAFGSSVSSISSIFGDKTKGAPNAPPITSLANSKLLFIGITILAVALLMKLKR